MVTPPAQLACMQGECGLVRIPVDWWQMLVHPVRTCMYKPSRTQWRTRADFRELAADWGADFRELAADWMRTYANLSRTKNTYSRTRRELAANLYISVRGLART